MAESVRRGCSFVISVPSGVLGFALTMSSNISLRETSSIVGMDAGRGCGKGMSLANEDADIEIWPGNLEIGICVRWLNASAGVKTDSQSSSDGV